MINDQLALTGKLVITKNGEVEQEINNLVVAAGKNWVANRMVGGDKGGMTHMAVGSGTTAAAAEDTGLETEFDRNALTVANGTAVDNAVTYECTWGPGDGTGAITEAGLLNADTGGDMLARTVFAVVNKGEADTITISWVVTVS